MRKNLKTDSLFSSLPCRGDLEGQKPPAKGYFIVRYELNNDYADAIIQVTDINGRTVRQHSSSMTRDYLVIPTQGLLKGNYFVKLILNGSEAGVQKVIIQ